MVRVTQEWFWSQVHVTSTCWWWQWRFDHDGYGRFWWDGHGKYLMAHRFAYELVFGPVPKGKEIDHLCRNRPCVNPWHLEPVFHRINLERGKALVAMADGRQSRAEALRAQTHCHLGHPFDEANLYVDPGGGRNCRICRREVKRRWLAQRRKAAAAT